MPQRPSQHLSGGPNMHPVRLWVRARPVHIRLGASRLLALVDTVGGQRAMRNVRL